MVPTSYDLTMENKFTYSQTPQSQKIYKGGKLGEMLLKPRT